MIAHEILKKIIENYYSVISRPFLQIEIEKSFKLSHEELLNDNKTFIGVIIKKCYNSIAKIHEIKF